MEGLGDVHAGDLGQVLAADAHVEGLLAQARAFAFGTKSIAAVPAEKDADVEFVLLRFEVVEEAADEVVDGVALGFGEVTECHGRADLASADRLLEIAEPGAVLRLGPGIDRALVEGKALVGNHAVHVEVDRVAEALAARTGAVGRIEAEEDRLRDTELGEAGLALELLVEAQGLRPVGALEDDFAGFAVTDLDGVDEALMEIGADGDAIDENEDGLAEVDIEERFGGRELE